MSERFHDDEYTELVYYTVNNDDTSSPDPECSHPGCDRVHVHVLTDYELRARDEAIIDAAYRLYVVGQVDVSGTDPYPYDVIIAAVENGEPT